MKYCIYDKIVDSFLCHDNSWESYNMDGLSQYKPMSFKTLKEVKKKIKELEKEFLAHSLESEIDFEILKFEEWPYYKFYNL